MKACAFGRTTGRAELRQCPTCGTEARHVEIAYRTPSGIGTLYLADHHHAPCGSVCVMSPSKPGEPAPTRLHLRRDCGACARLAAGKFQTSGRSAGAA